MAHSHHGHGDMDMGPGMGDGQPMCSMNMLFTWDTTNLCIVFSGWRVTSTWSLVVSLLGVVVLTAGYEALREVARRYESSLDAKTAALPHVFVKTYRRRETPVAGGKMEPMFASMNEDVAVFPPSEYHDDPHLRDFDAAAVPNSTAERPSIVVGPADEGQRSYDALHTRRDRPFNFLRSLLFFRTGAAAEAEAQRSKIIKAALYGAQVFYSFFIMLLFMTYNGWIMLAVGVGAFVGYLMFGSGSASKTAACH